MKHLRHYTCPESRYPSFDCRHRDSILKLGQYRLNHACLSNDMYAYSENPLEFAAFSIILISEHYYFYRRTVRIFVKPSLFIRFIH